jgi:hypothetical protein
VADAKKHAVVAHQHSLTAHRLTTAAYGHSFK